MLTLSPAAVSKGDSRTALTAGRHVPTVSSTMLSGTHRPEGTNSLYLGRGGGRVGTGDTKAITAFLSFKMYVWKATCLKNSYNVKVARCMILLLHVLFILLCTVFP